MDDVRDIFLTSMIFFWQVYKRYCPLQKKRKEVLYARKIYMIHC